MSAQEAEGSGDRIASAPVAGALGKTAATGFVLLSGQNLITRVITLAAQVVLADLLLPEEFGLFAVSMGVVSFAALLQQIGIREVLIARQKRFERWSSIGMWIAGAVAVTSVVGIGLAAPVAAWFYNDQRLIGLMLVLALSQPLFCLTIVHEAKLQIDMRFKELAGFNLVQGAMVPVLMVACALAGLGAYSFVLPRLAAGVVRAAMLCRWVRVPIERRARLNRWKHMIGPGAIVLLTALVNNVAAAAPALMLGKVSGKEIAGYFSFAFTITLQGVIVLGTTLDNVMFPTLGRLKNEPERQRAAYLRATSALSAAMVPACVLQAMLAQPLFEVLFGDKWKPAVEVMQILSVGVIYLAVYIPASSLLLAQSRFRARLLVGTLWALVFLGVGLVGASELGGAGVAWALAAVYLLSGIHLSAVAMKPIGGGWMDAVRVLVPSHVVGALAAAPSLWIMHMLPGTTMIGNIIEMVVVGAVFGIGYAVGLRLCARGVWDDLARAGEPVLRRVGLGGLVAPARVESRDDR